MAYWTADILSPVKLYRSRCCLDERRFFTSEILSLALRLINIFSLKMSQINRYTNEIKKENHGKWFVRYLFTRLRVIRKLNRRVPLVRFPTHHTLGPFEKLSIYLLNLIAHILCLHEACTNKKTTMRAGLYPISQFLISGK